MQNTKTMKIKMSTGEKIFSVINYIFLALVAVACLYPMLYVLFASFSNSNQLMRHTGILLWPQGLSAGAYEMVFKNPMIARGYLNTMFVLVMSLILQITLTSLGAYFLSRRNVMFQKPIMLLITFTMFFSGGMIPTYLNMKSLHLTGSLWGLILPFMISVYNLIILKTSFASIPESLIEAARIDGAGFFQQFWYITLPNIKGSLALCALLRTIDTFRLFEKVNVLTGGGPAGTTTTITQFLYTYGIKSLDFGFGSAGAIVMTLLVLILSSFYIKRAMG